MKSYRIVWHKVFRYQYEHLPHNSLLKRQVDKQLEVIEKSPETAGNAIKYLAPHLAGRIKTVRVGGPKKYRMIIMVHREERIVEVCFIDPRLRKDIDYDTLPFGILEIPENQIDLKRLKKFIIK